MESTDARFSGGAQIKIRMKNSSIQTLPPVTEEDEGKILKVVGGQWKAVELPVYNKNYSVTPTVEGTTLDTAQKYMHADVKVEKIPYFDIGNSAGGSTVYIANKVEIN